VDDHPVILFDGVCNYCNAVVNFIIRQDKKNLLRFASLQSSAGQRLLKQYHLPTEQLNSFVFISKGRAYTRSTAGLMLYNHLPWYWKWVQLFRIIPPIFRNAVYDFVAKNRYKWFGKKDQCMVPAPELRQRFLD
jgi:predicted DCC family thiol-disulfide oxidoreductase YuxK